MMSVKCVGPVMGDGAPPPAEQSTKQAQLGFSICGERSCALPLLPYTSLLKNLAGKERRAGPVAWCRSYSLTTGPRKKILSILLLLILLDQF